MNTTMHDVKIVTREEVMELEAILHDLGLQRAYLNQADMSAPELAQAWFDLALKYQAIDAASNYEACMSKYRYYHK